MNFKTLIFIAGAVAAATASSPVEAESNKMAESVQEESNQLVQENCAATPSLCAQEESNELVQRKNCNAVNPKLCASCRGAASRRAVR